MWPLDADQLMACIASMYKAGCRDACWWGFICKIGGAHPGQVADDEGHFCVHGRRADVQPLGQRIAQDHTPVTDGHLPSKVPPAAGLQDSIPVIKFNAAVASPKKLIHHHLRHMRHGDMANTQGDRHSLCGMQSCYGIGHSAVISSLTMPCGRPGRISSSPGLTISLKTTSGLERQMGPCRNGL